MLVESEVAGAVFRIRRNGTVSRWELPAEAAKARLVRCTFEDASTPGMHLIVQGFLIGGGSLIGVATVSNKDDIGFAVLERNGIAR